MIKLSSKHSENCDILYCESGEKLIKLRFHYVLPEGFYESAANAVMIETGAKPENICVIGGEKSASFSPEELMKLLSEAIKLISLAESDLSEVNEHQALEALKKF